jgi:hypothetical protein
MIRKILLTGSVVCVLAQADFSYEQSSKITGGAMQSMMRVAGVFSKTAREPIKSTIMVKGDRMATVTGGERIDVIDLNAETFTEIDLKKKTYAVVTFAEMAAAIEKAAAEARKKEGNEAEFTMKADVKPTGATRNIGGMDTKQTIVTLTTEVEDKKEKSKGQMTFVMDMWLAPKISGYDEVRNFYTRFAQKVNWSPYGGMVGAMMAGQSKGMSELVKEMSKLDGIPVYQVVKIGGMAGAGQQGSDMGGAQPQQQPQAQEQPSQSASDTAAGAALGRLGGRLGGLGGFGRKKKPEPEQAPPPQQQPASQQQAQASGPSGAPGSLLEMTSELAGFSNAPVDGSKFDVPAGFKKVDSQRYKN